MATDEGLIPSRESFIDWYAFGLSIAYTAPSVLNLVGLPSLYGASWPFFAMTNLGGLRVGWSAPPAYWAS